MSLGLSVAVGAVLFEQTVQDLEDRTALADW